ncbi:acyltransferase family protein [Shimia sp. W99]
MARAYRTDIDGLRAIAILGVVLYHIGLKQMSGGYAGVDVFFVISGYLIGGNILDDLAAGRFSFRNFYTRRARRILPALVVMVLVVMVLGWFTLMPHPYRYMGGAAVTALLSLSNIWFLTRIDYFNPDALLDPLIHTWSLGIEEQFYLIIPLLLLLLWRWRTGLIAPVLLGLIVLSLALAVTRSGEYRTEAFYLLHTRAWELLAGVVVAWSERNRPLRAALHTPLYAVGLILILAGLWIVPPAAPWPGLWTLPTVVGTALILVAPQATAPLRALLANPPMRFVGLISYSLYLWHQPVISMLKASNFWPATLSGVLLVLALMIAVATLSWRFVEQPFRTPGPLPRFKPRLLMASALAILMIAIGGEITEGYPKRMPPQVLDVLAMRQSWSPTYRKCLYVRSEVPGIDLSTSCRFGPDKPETIAVWGDSHAARLAEPLADDLAKRGHSVRQLTLSSCMPISGLIIHGQTRAQQCPVFNDLVETYLDAHPEITRIVLFAHWKKYMFNDTGPNMFGYVGEDGVYARPLDASGPNTRGLREQAIVNLFAAQLQRISKGRQVILVLPAPRPLVDIPRYYATRMWWGSPLPEKEGFPRTYENALATPLRDIFARAITAADLPGEAITVIDPADFSCDATTCDVIRDGNLLLSDENHPSLPGLDLFIPAITEAITGPVTRSNSTD